MSAGAAGAAAAAAKRRREQEEEESLTAYTQTDLEEGWEFKILRSATNTFGKPEHLRDALAQEARAGWIMVEKFDDGRIRLKRPFSARDGDPGLDFDPYRSRYGVSDVKVALCIIGGVLIMLAAIITIAVLASRPPSTP